MYSCKRRGFPLILFLLTSCSVNIPADFPFIMEDGAAQTVIAHSKQAVSGVIEAKEKSAVYEYSLPEAARIAENSSFMIDYTVRDENGAPPQMRFNERKNETRREAWQLPLNAAFLGLSGGSGRYRYAVPLDAGSLERITIAAEKASVVIHSFSIVKRFFGFEKTENDVLLSPFVYKEAEGPGATQYTINPDGSHDMPGAKSLLIKNLSPGARINTRAFGYESSRFATDEIALPYGILGKSPYPVTVTGEVDAVILSLLPAPEFPAPITADPGVILDYPQMVWRNDAYEVFKWASFPNVLIFDTADYAAQDKLFKRLAFFVEKKGFRGTLVPDSALEGLHGWNAHDYRAKDLAAFYERARAQDFPLSQEEERLRQILADAGIIRIQNGGIEEGSGAVISVSRESNGYLRRLFMAHEGFHGIYFVDEDFRDFTERRYNALDAVSTRVLLSYFDFQSYDITDDYLVKNEFMAHILQQGAGAASEYFGKTILERLERSEWRRSALPEKDEETGTWPRLGSRFEEEAQAFSNYVSQRWRLAAGRVWLIE